MSGVSILQFIGQFFSTLLAGLLGAGESFFSSFINSLGALFYTIFADYGVQVSKYGWAIPIVIVVSLSAMVMGALAELSVGKVIEDVE